MAFAPLRFLHAADARLDQAIAETPKLPPRLASVVQDATRAAFDRFIALAIEHEVDFVLLAGNTFVEADESLAARLSLLDGFEQLDKSHIPALVLPGALDPLEAWRRIPDLPDNVTLLESGPRGIVPIKRDDKVMARVGSELFMPIRKKSRKLRDELRSASQRAVPFKIAALSSSGDADELLRDWSPDLQSSPESSQKAHDADSNVEGRSGLLVSADYVALGGGSARRTLARRRGIAHDAGPLQGRNADQSGPRGCTLVTVESDGTVRCDFLPTASVRWERFRLEVPDPFNLAELAAGCRENLASMRVETCENAWIIQWILRGNKNAIDELEEDALRRHLQHDLANLANVPSVANVAHHFIAEADSTSPDPRAAVDVLWAAFAEALQSGLSNSHDVFRRHLEMLRATDAHWASTVDEMLGELSAEAISANAHRVGHQLFAGAPGQGAGR
jgi:exonuclease SbcD